MRSYALSLIFAVGCTLDVDLTLPTSDICFNRKIEQVGNCRGVIAKDQAEYDEICEKAFYGGIAICTVICDGGFVTAINPDYEDIARDECD